MIKRTLALLAITISLSAHADSEIYMANQAGGYLTLTHESCKAEKVKDQFPWHAYGTEANGTTHDACYVIPSPPTPAELSEIPQGVSIIPVINLIDLEDGSVHTLRADWFTSDNPGSEETF